MEWMRRSNGHPHSRNDNNIRPCYDEKKSSVMKTFDYTTCIEINFKKESRCGVLQAAWSYCLSQESIVIKEEGASIESVFLDRNKSTLTCAYLEIPVAEWLMREVCKVSIPRWTPPSFPSKRLCFGSMKQFATRCLTVTFWLAVSFILWRKCLRWERRVKCSSSAKNLSSV